MNHQEEIPVWSYVNFQILYQIHIAQLNKTTENITVADLIKKTDKHIGSNIPLESFYSPINSGAIFSFLYSLLVVPKEIFKNENLDFFKSFNFKLTDYFEIISGADKIQHKEKIFRILRNSISHVNYHVDDTDKYSVRLWNENRDGLKDVVLKSDINKLSNFSVELAKYYNTKIKK